MAQLANERGSRKLRWGSGVLVLAAALVGVPGATHAAAESAAGGAVIQESDCFEVPTPRAVVTAKAAALVPAAFTLPTTATTSLQIITYTCRSFSIEGRRQVGGDGSTTVSIGAVPVSAVDDAAVSGFNAYVLWYATDNAIQLAELRASGWPASLFPRTTSSVPVLPRPGDVGEVRFAVHGPGVDYDLQAAVQEPVVVPVESTATFWAVSPRGEPLRLTFHNQTGSPGARTTTTTADLGGITVLQGLLTDPKFAVIPQPGVVARLGYSRGAWTSQVLPGR